MAATKSRAFTGLVYLDSAPDNWQDTLRESLGMWLISPLHQPDPVEDMETGAVKALKAHYHVMYFHGAPISAKLARSIFESWPWIVTPPRAEFFQVGSVRNLSRYFVHLDQPEKQQWAEKPEEVLTVLNGFPLDLERELTRKDKRELMKQTFAFIQDRSVTEFSELVDVLMFTGDWLMFDFVTSNYGVVQNYLMSLRKRAAPEPRRDGDGGAAKPPVGVGVSR